MIGNVVGTGYILCRCKKNMSLWQIVSIWTMLVNRPKSHDIYCSLDYLEDRIRTARKYFNIGKFR